MDQVILQEQKCAFLCVEGRVNEGVAMLDPSAQRLVWAAKQPLGKAAVGALFA